MQTKQLGTTGDDKNVYRPKSEVLSVFTGTSS